MANAKPMAANVRSIAHITKSAISPANFASSALLFLTARLTVEQRAEFIVCWQLASALAPIEPKWLRKLIRN